MSRLSADDPAPKHPPRDVFNRFKIIEEFVTDHA
jgi:hypothetical protein